MDGGRKRVAKTEVLGDQQVLEKTECGNVREVVEGVEVDVKWTEVDVQKEDGTREKVVLLLPEIVSESTTARERTGVTASSTVTQISSRKTTRKPGVPRKINGPEIRIKTPNGGSEYRCFNCIKTFSTRGMLRRHEEIHGGGFHCWEKNCGATFHNQTTLTKHFKELHRDKREGDRGADVVTSPIQHNPSDPAKGLQQWEPPPEVGHWFSPEEEQEMMQDLFLTVDGEGNESIFENMKPLAFDPTVAAGVGETNNEAEEVKSEEVPWGDMNGEDVIGNIPEDIFSGTLN